MNRLLQLVIAVFSLLFFISVQASVGQSVPAKECVIFADEAADEAADGKKDDGKKEGADGEEEEEEPDCD